MKDQTYHKSSVKGPKIRQGYDEGVKGQGSGLENHGVLIAPPAEGDQLDPYGKPRWDDTERAAPPASSFSDGLRVSAPSASPHDNLSLSELQRRAEVLSIPGRAKMTKMQLAAALTSAID